MNMRVKIIDRVFLVVFSVENPTNEEWDGFLRLVEAQGVELTAKLVLTDGGAPSLEQVKRLRILLDGHAVPIAVVSPRVRVRASVLVLSWFDRWLRAFSPAGLHDAIAFLKIPGMRAEMIERELHKLHGELAGSVPTTDVGR